MSDTEHEINAPIDEWRKARKKPVEIEFRGPYYDTDTIETIEGDFEIDQEYIDEHEGYVIIRGVEGEEYPCGIDIFRETYEQVPLEETDIELDPERELAFALRDRDY